MTTILPEPQNLKEWMEVRITKMHADMLGKETVNYRPSGGENPCSACRWFNEPFQGELSGYCQLVAGDILPSDTCDRQEIVNQQIQQAPAEAPAAETPMSQQPANDASMKAKGFQHTILTKKSHSILKTNYAFNWALPTDVDAEEYYLIKGVAATEGEFKSGDIFTKENLGFGAGAMSTAGMQGIGLLDIDHFHEALPERYAKYGLEGVNGEIGFIIDAGISVNKVTDSDGKTKDLTQVEWYGYTTNKKVAELVNEGKFIGTSVEDWSRSADCETDENGIPTGCSIEGSHFIHLGLILDETPDSHGTWVNSVTNDDLDQWERNAEKNAPSLIIVSKDARKLKGIPAAHWNKMKKHASRKKLHDLTTYLNDDGTFKDGKEGIIDYLTNDVKVDDATASNIADYIMDHPEERNSWQMEMMSAGDWVAWYTHLQTAKYEQIIENQRKVLAKHNIKCLSCGNEKKHKTILRVMTKRVAANEDGSCPVGSSPDPEHEGQCLETSLYISKNEDGTCPDGYEPNPDGDDCIKSSNRVTKIEGECPAGTVENPDNPESCLIIESHIEKPEGGCPEGWVVNPEDDTQCIEVTADETYEIIDMPEGGECPEGFEPINEGTQCTDETDTDAGQGGDAPTVDMGRFLKSLKKRHHVTKEMEADLLKAFSSKSLTRKVRKLRSVAIEKDVISNYEANVEKEHLEPINIEKELKLVKDIFRMNRPGKYQVGQVIGKYRLALLHLQQFQKKEK